MSPEYSPAWKAAQAKLGRAREHLDTLGVDIADLRERNVYSVTVHREADSGWWIAKARINEEPSPRLSVIVGEIAYECLSALNHLTWELAARKVGRKKIINIKNQVQFPVALKPSAFASNSLVTGRLVSKRALAIIEGLQPYKGGHGPRGPHEHLLAVIKEIADADKHRVLTARHSAVEFNGVGFTWDTSRASGERIGAYMRQFVTDGTPVARIRFGVGNDQAKVGVEGDPTPDIVFGTESWTVRRADLEACVDWSFRALRAFGPLFPPR